MIYIYILFHINNIYIYICIYIYPMNYRFNQLMCVNLAIVWGPHLVIYFMCLFVRLFVHIPDQCYFCRFECQFLVKFQHPSYDSMIDYIPSNILIISHAISIFDRIFFFGLGLLFFTHPMIEEKNPMSQAISIIFHPFFIGFDL